MTRKPAVVLPLATAIASLIGAGTATNETKAAIPGDTKAAPRDNQLAKPQTANFAVGNDLLGIVVSERADGKVFAQHVSHASHASHASHVSSR
jgi:hypothetical protein